MGLGSIFGYSPRSILFLTWRYVAVLLLTVATGGWLDMGTIQAFYASIVIYNVGMCLVKISILLQYRRVFTGKLMYWISTCSAIFFGCWAITISFLLTLICMPVEKYWYPSIEGRCFNSLVIWYIMASFNLITDIALFIMPLPVIGSLQLRRKQKYTLIFVFGLGLLLVAPDPPRWRSLTVRIELLTRVYSTCIISTIRLGTLKAASETDDPNWDNVDAAYLSFLEVCTSILAASLPTLRPIFAKVMPSVFGTRSQVGTDGRYGTRTSTYGRGSMFVRATAPSTAESTASLNKDEGIELPPRSPSRAQHLYSVSVMGGDRTAADVGSVSEGIRTTTIVTQRVSEDDNEPDDLERGRGEQGYHEAIPR
jgi:hypothetical protein